MKPHMTDSDWYLPDLFRGTARSKYIRINHVGFIILYFESLNLFCSFVMAAAGKICISFIACFVFFSIMSN